jgi:hypothetical protein
MNYRIKTRDQKSTSITAQVEGSGTPHRAAAFTFSRQVE